MFESKEKDEFEYTRIRKEDVQKKLFRIHSREEVEKALMDYNEACEKEPDAAPFREQELKDLCDDCDIDFEQLMRNHSLLNSLKTKEKLETDFFRVLHDAYKQTPSAGDYMERLVRILAPEYEKDTVRTAILKKFILGAGEDWKIYSTKAIFSWAKEQMDEADKHQYDTADSEMKLKMVVSVLNDSIFENPKFQKERDLGLLKLCDDFANGTFRNNGGKTRVYLYYFAFMFGMASGNEEDRCPKDKTVTLRLKDETGICHEKRYPDINAWLFEDYYCDNFIRFLADDYKDPKYGRAYEKEPSGEGINYKNFAECIYLYYLIRKDLYKRPAEGIEKAEEKIAECIKEALKEENSVGQEELSENDTFFYQDQFYEHMISLKKEELVGYVIHKFNVSWMQGKAITSISSETRGAHDAFSFFMEEIEKAYQQKWQEGSDEQKKNPFFPLQLKWNLSESLQHLYSGSEEERFFRVIVHLEQRLRETCNKNVIANTEFLAKLLYFLYYKTKDGKAVTTNELASSFDDLVWLVDGYRIDTGIEILNKIGFHAEKIRKEKSSDRHVEWILCQNGSLLRVMTLLKSEASEENKKSEQEEVPKNYLSVLKKVIKEAMNEAVDKNITRSKLIAIYANYYICRYHNKKINSFSKFYEDFTDKINTQLDGARFQIFSEKNILDIYVLISVYMYLCEKNQI